MRHQPPIKLSSEREEKAMVRNMSGNEKNKVPGTDVNEFSKITTECVYFV